MDPTRMAAGTAAVTGAAGAAWTLAHRRAMRGSDWAPSRIEPAPFGPLWARAAGSADDAVVLLHGLVSTGDVYGSRYDELARARRLVVPDLLGFGRSMAPDRSSFGTDDHLDALDELARRAGLLDTPRWTIGAHSMGSALALAWAARHADRVGRVVCWGAPVHASPEDARANAGGSVMARLFALDTGLAERACAVSCRHRAAMGWMSAALEPALPVAVARAVPLHTWPAYRDSIRQLVLDVDWANLLTSCDRARITVDLVWGRDDRIGDRDEARRLVAATSHASIEVLTTGDHRLPLTDPDTCIERLTST